MSEFLPFLDLDGPAPTAVGTSTAMTHMGCSTQPKVTTTKLKVGTVWYCHKCQRSGFAKDRGTYGASPSVPEPERRIATPPSITPLDSPGLGPESVTAWEWLNSFGVTSRVYPDLDYGTMGRAGPGPTSLVFTMTSRILDPANPVQWTQIRRMDGMAPKWKTVKHYDGPKLPWIGSPYAITTLQRRMPIIIVEDIVSAMKIYRVLDENGWRAAVASANGLTLSFEAVVRMSSDYSGAIVVADDDVAGRTDGPKLVRDISPLFNGNIAFFAEGFPSPKDLDMRDLSDAVKAWLSGTKLWT